MVVIPMVTDQEICRCVESLLLHSPPGAVTSIGAVVSHVESSLGGLDLSHKAAFIRDHISLLLSPQLPNYPHPHSRVQQDPVTARFGYPPPPGAHQQFQLQQPPQPPPPQPVISPGAVRPVTVVAAPKQSSPAGVKRRGGPGGLSKVCGVSPELQAIVGEPTMARTQVLLSDSVTFCYDEGFGPIVKQLWAYIRKNNLQDPANKRKIICNDELRLVFETDCTDMFKMNKLLAKHILPLEPRKDSGPDSKRLKATITADVSSATNTNADQSPALVSIALAEFFGTGEREMLESEASRRVWEYIKINTLQDPLNEMMIVCDSKLQQLFGCETFSALGISEMLSSHLK